MMYRRFAVTLTFLLGWLLLPTATPAAVVPLTVEEMTAIADDIVVVRVESTKAEIQNGLITTTARMQVLDTIKGSNKGVMEISYPGGRWGKLVMAVPDVPDFAPDDEAIVFLSSPVKRLPKESQAQFNPKSKIVASPQVVGGRLGILRIENAGDDAEGTGKRRKGAEPIPAEAKVFRSTTKTTLADEGTNHGFTAVISSLRTVAAAQEQKAREKAPLRKIGGVHGEFAIPDRSSDPLIRALDPLPSIAYASDAELKAANEKMRQEIEKAAAARAAKAAEVKP